MKHFKLSRRVQYGSMAILLTVLMIVGIIGVNVIITLVTNRLELTVDMTQENRYELSDASVKLIRGLKEKVNVDILATEEDMKNVSVFENTEGYGKEIVEVLKKYQTLSNGNVKVNFIDVTKNPTFLNQFPGIGEVDTYSVIVSSSKGGYQVISLDDLYYWYYENDYTSQPPVGINVERMMAAAILYVDQSQKRHAVFLTGNGEMDTPAFMSFLSQNNFEVNSMKLAAADIPKNADLVILNSPTLDYTAGELAKIEEYLSRKNSCMFVALDATAGELPELEKLLNDYGIDYNSATVYDTRVSSGESNIIAQLTDDDILASLSSTSTNIVMPSSRSITLNQGRPTSFTSRELLKSSDSSYSKAFNNAKMNQYYAKEAGDKDGPFIIAAVSDYQYSSGDYVRNNKILALGSGYSLSDNIFKSKSYSNQTFISAVLTNFFGSPDLSKYEAKEFTAPQMLIIDWMKPVYLIILMIIPIMVFLAGIVVWIKRKNK